VTTARYLSKGRLVVVEGRLQTVRGPAPGDRRLARPIPRRGEAWREFTLNSQERSNFSLKLAALAGGAGLASSSWTAARPGRRARFYALHLQTALWGGVDVVRA
jgi:hypothetical protein